MCLILEILRYVMDHFDGLVQDCSNSSALAMELLQSYTKPICLWEDQPASGIETKGLPTSKTSVQRILLVTLYGIGDLGQHWFG